MGWIWSPIISIQLTTETYILQNRSLYFHKITTENGKQYAFSCPNLNILTNWTSIHTYDKDYDDKYDNDDDDDDNDEYINDSIKNTISVNRIPYNIEILHNHENKAMVNIMKGNKDIIRQEINPWEFRYSQVWITDM